MPSRRPAPRFWPLLALALLAQSLAGQPEPPVFFHKIFEGIHDGKLSALRDMASLLDDSTLAVRAKNALTWTCFFPETALDWSKVNSKNDFYPFFYQNRERLQFDPNLNLWLLEPLDEMPPDTFRLTPLPAPPAPDKLLKIKAQALRTAVTQADTAQFRQSLETLAQLNRREAWDLILENARQAAELAKVFSPQHFNPRPTLLRCLANCPDDEALKLALKWVETEAISPADAEIPLSEMTNHYINKVSREGILGQLRPLFDSLGSLAALRHEGYDRALAFEPLFFEEAVDYFGNALSRAGPQPWVWHNAEQELAATHHPRALLYLAARAFRNRSNTDSYTKLERFAAQNFQPLERLTNLRVAVRDRAGQLLDASLNDTWLFNYTRYWATHWPDYEWDERRGHFVNRRLAETSEATLDRLFQRLAAPNDSIARAAFVQLTEADPADVLPLAEQYRQTLRARNPALPDFRHRFLESLCLLVDFCRENQFAWKPRPAVAVWLAQASGELAPKLRYQLENQAIDSFVLADLTAVEFAALLHSGNRPFGFSAARVLDEIYSRHWSEVLDEAPQLRFFLKKSALFAAVGTVGAANSYGQKFDLGGATTRQKLTALLGGETDEDVLAQVHFLLGKSALAAPTPPQNLPAKVAETAADFAQNLARLASADSLSAEDFNRVFASPFFKMEAQGGQVLAALGKLKPLSQLRRLAPPARFSGERDFPFFESLALKTKDLPTVARLFNGDAPTRLLEFFQKKLADAPPADAAPILNELLRVDWLRQHLNQLPAPSDLTKNWQVTLQTWLDEADNISEFEEEQTQLHRQLLAGIGQPLATRVEATFGLGLGQSALFKIQRELLAGASWRDLAGLAPLLPKLAADPESGAASFQFLTLDFGLPPLSFDEPAERELLGKILTQVPENEAYKFYLRRFGVLFETAAGKLDFPKIRRMLQRDLLVPFAGGGGERRDWYVFALVKILEAEFGTRLGFPEKLNENQTFYTFNAGKRAAAWAEFLTKK